MRHATPHGPPPGRGGWVLRLLLALLAAGAAPAAEPAAGNATPAPDALDAFVRQLGPEPRARLAPLITAAGASQETRRGALLEALLTLNPELSRARDELIADRPAAALPILDGLLAAPDPFLATHAAWLRVRALVAGERYEDALATLTAVQANAARYTLVADDLLYTEGRLRACLLERPAAATILRRYLKEFPQAPPERRQAAQELLAEIEQAKEISLTQVAALMDDSRRRLQLGDCSETTQARQRQIALVLEQVIEKVEEKPTKGGRPAKAPGKGGKPGEGKKPGEKPGEGAKESSLTEKDPTVSLEPPVADGTPDGWAKAYARDRETVQRELPTRLPERYRDLIEQYYQSLATEGQPENSGAP